MSPYTFIRSASREQIEEADLAVCVITRQEIEHGTVGAVVDRLMMLTDDDAPALRLEGNLMLVFDGYDSDPRELYEMEPVRAFMREVTEQWPYWFHFLDREAAAFGMLLSLLIHHRGRGRDQGRDVLCFDADEVAGQCQRLLAAMDALQRRLELSNHHREEVASKVLELLKAAGLKSPSLPQGLQGGPGSTPCP